jgi:hypothetical protein
MFPLLSFEQANPYLTGYKYALKNREQQIKNQYLPKTLAEALKKAELYNQYYPQDILSQIGERGAHTNLLGEQARWYGPNIQSQIGERGANTRLLGEKFRTSNLENTNEEERLANLHELLEAMKNEGINPPPEENNGNINANLPFTNVEGSPAINTPQSINNPSSGGINPNQNRIERLKNINDIYNRMSRKNTITGTPEEKLQNSLKLAQGKMELQQNNKQFINATQASTAAKESKTALDILEAASKKLKPGERGAVIGRLPAISSAAQEYDQASSMLMQSVMESMRGTGQMSQAKMRFIESLKPTRKLNEEANTKVINVLRSMADRSSEKQTFLKAAEGLSPSDKEVLWNFYNEERPEYDAAKERPIKSNLKTFQDYLNPKALDAALNGRSYSPRVPKGNIEMQKNMNNENGIRVKMPNGQIGSIPKDKLEQALSMGAEKI